MATVNDKLKSSISKVRSAVHGKGVHFDFVTSGAGGILLIGEGTSAVDEAKKEAKSTTVISGVCYSHEGAFVFETKSNPSATLAAQIQKCLKDHAGVSSKVEARSAADMEHQEHEHESEQNASSHQPVDAAKAAKISAHVKTLMAKLVGPVANSNAGKAVKTKLADANIAYKKGDLDAAEKLLAQGDNLIKEEQEHEEESEQPNS